MKVLKKIWRRCLQKLGTSGMQNHDSGILDCRNHGIHRVCTLFHDSIISLLRYFILFLIAEASSTGFAFGQTKFSASTCFPGKVSYESYRAYDRSWALIVAVDEYHQTAPRTSSVASAKALQHYLVSHEGFRQENIITLFNSSAKLSVIFEALKKLQTKNPYDRIVVFLSGRGTTLNINTQNELGFFIPYDGQLATPETTAATCLPLAIVRRMVDSTGIRHALVLLDFTVGGLPVLRRYSGIPPRRNGVARIIQFSAAELISAGDRIEESLDDQKTKESLFTENIIDALSDSATDTDNDGIISGTELATAVSERVTMISNRTLHPQFGYLQDGGGDFVFIRPKNDSATRLFLDVSPRDAEILIDRILVHDSPLGISVPAPVLGTHELRIQREGCYGLTETIFTNGRLTIRATAQLERIPTPDILVKVNQPNSKVYMDGKLIGLPDESLLMQNVPLGEHKIAGYLDGYFPDSSTISVEKAGQVIVNLNYRSRSGVLTVLTSPDASIEVDGAEIGKGEVLRRPILAGTYELRIAGPGYEPFTQQFTVSDTQAVEIVHPMERPTHTGAIVRSMVFPGWGQSYSGRTGIFFSLGFLATAGAAAGMQAMYQQAVSEYHSNYTRYQAAKTESDAALYLSKATRAKKNKTNYQNYQLVAAGAAGIIYLYNLYDVLTNNPQAAYENLSALRVGFGGSEVAVNFCPVNGINLSICFSSDDIF
ncbi:MAG: PEGA domain-containing protein [Bacteroidota bacterium]|nr:PEGA domain-containing protein [Bacteroidota bacterium]